MGEQGIYDQQVHRFHKGMDMDSDYSVLQENTYPYAENFRLTKSGDAITGVLENIDGFNKISLTYTKDSIEIIGHCVIRKYVILFARSIAGNILEKNGYIFRLELKYDDRNNPLFVDRNLNNCLIYSDLEWKEKGFPLQFGKIIKSIGKWEDSEHINIYWTDFYSDEEDGVIGKLNQIRRLNIMMTTKELGELSPDDINTTVDGNVFKSPKIISVENGGTLKIGLYKYGYRIIFENGSTSSWIFHADYIALQSGELNPLDSFGFEAKNPENMSTSIEHSNKYINGYIDLSGISNATGVEVIRCYWGDKLTNIPKNSIIESKGKDEIANADGVVFKDYDGDFGDGKFVIETKSSTEVIAESTSVRFAAKDLSANRDVLFAANIKEISNEVLNKSIGRNINSDYSTGIDFRAYRWYENKSSGNMECHLFCTDGGSLPMIDNKKYNYILLTRNKSAENTPYIPRDGSVKISYYYINNSADGFEFDRGINSGPQSGWNKTAVMVDAPYGVGKNIIPENVFWYNRYNIQTNIYNIYSNITGDIRCASSQCDKNIMGKELGGTGDNISYKFIEEDINIDDEDSCAKKEYFWDSSMKDFGGKYISKCNIEKKFESSKINSYKTPTSYKWKGYKRGEIYSFGIVFIIGAGYTSSVYWIGDIKFPGNETHPYYTAGKATALGIEFNINSKILKENGISSYYIVRCRRSSLNDMTILSQGYISNIRPLNVRDKEHNNSAFRGDMIWGNAFFPEFSCDHPLVMTTTFSQGWVSYDSNDIAGHSDFTWWGGERYSTSNIDPDMGKFKGYCHTAVSLVCPEVVMYGKNDESLKRAFTSSMSSGWMKITAIMSCAYGYDAKSSTTTDFDDYFYPNNSWRIMSHVKSNKLYYSDGYSSASYTDRSYIPVLDWCLGTTPTGIAVPSTMIFSPFSLRNGRPEGSGGNQLDYTKGYWRFGVHVPGLNRIIGGINTSNLTGNQGSPWRHSLMKDHGSFGVRNNFWQNDSGRCIKSDAEGDGNKYYANNFFWGKAGTTDSGTTQYFHSASCPFAGAMNVRKYRNNTYFRPIKLMVKNQSGNNATWRGERYKFLDGFQRTENISTPNSNSLRLDCFSINGTPLFTHTPNAHTGTIRWGCPFDETTSMTESLNNTTLASTMNDTDTIGIWNQQTPTGKLSVRPIYAYSNVCSPSIYQEAVYSGGYGHEYAGYIASYYSSQGGPKILVSLKNPITSLRGMKFNDSYSFFQEMSYSNITNWTRPYTFNVSEIPVVDIYTGNKEQYGGNRISALSNREYIQCSDLNNISDGDVVQVFNGDIFITYMHYLNATNIGKDITANDPYHGWRAIADSQWTMSHVVIIPVETVHNLGFISGEYTGSNSGLSSANAMVQWASGQYYWPSFLIRYNQYNEVLGSNQLKDWGSYNDLFDGDGKIFDIIKLRPINFSSATKDVVLNGNFDTRIYASEVKGTGVENVDNWQRFKILNYKDYDTKYGPINNILTHNNILYFWQENSFGIQHVQPRRLLNDNEIASNTALVLGDGDILDRYDYITNNYGCGNHWAACAGLSTIYWYDYFRRCICAYKPGSQVINLSKQLRVQSYIDTRNPLNPFVAYDPSTKEVHFNLNDDKTLIFNEDLSIFNSFYTYNPEYYIQSDSSLMSINSGSIWAHNYKMADYSYKNRFYNGDRFVSKIKIVSNKSYNNSKIFDSMDFLTQAYKCENIFSSGALTYTIKDDPITTFNSVKFSTIRDTDIAELTTGERKLIYNKEEPSDYELGYTKREESFTLFIPRVFTIDSDDELFKPRMRGKFMVINLETGKYDDDNKFLGRRFSLSYIISKFRYSIR